MALQTITKPAANKALDNGYTPETVTNKEVIQMYFPTDPPFVGLHRPSALVQEPWAMTDLQAVVYEFASREEKTFGQLTLGYAINCWGKRLPTLKDKIKMEFVEDVRHLCVVENGVARLLTDDDIKLLLMETDFDSLPEEQIISFRPAFGVNFSIPVQSRRKEDGKPIRTFILSDKGFSTPKITRAERTGQAVENDRPQTDWAALPGLEKLIIDQIMQNAETTFKDFLAGIPRYDLPDTEAPGTAVDNLLERLNLEEEEEDKNSSFDKISVKP